MRRSRELLGTLVIVPAAILLSGLEPQRQLRLYLPFFGARRVVSLKGYLRQSSSLERLAEDVDQASAPIYALSELIEEESIRRSLEERSGLAPGSLEPVLARDRFRKLEVTGDQVLYQLVRQAPPAP